MLVESKDSRAIYLTASIIIAIAVTALLAMVYGVSLFPTFDDGLVQVPFVGVLAVLVPVISFQAILLWGVRPERHVVEGWALRKLQSDRTSAKYLANMAVFVLYIRPWESSSKLELPLKETLTNEYRRTMREPRFDEIIAEFRNVFWILLLTPLSFFDMSVYLPGVSFEQSFGLLLLGTAAGIILSFPFVSRNKNALKRVADYTFSRWVQETIATDMKRRTTDPFQLNSARTPVHAGILGISTAVVDLAARGDWAGFDRNSDNVEGQIPIPVPRRLSWSLLQDFLQLVHWSIDQAGGDKATRADISLRNAHLQISDALGIYRTTYTSSLLPDEITLASTVDKVLSRIRDLQTVLSLDAGFYESFDFEAMTRMDDSTHYMLGLIPFALKKKQVPPSIPSLPNKDKTAWMLVSAAEQGLLDMIIVLKTVAIWKVHPTVVAKAMRGQAAKALLEVDVGYDLDQLSSIESDLRDWVDEHPESFEPELVYRRFKAMVEKYGAAPVVHFAGNVTSRHVQLVSSIPGNVFEAISKFLTETRGRT